MAENEKTPETLIFGREVEQKITFVGLTGAGKTTLLRTIKGAQPDVHIHPTLGMDLEVVRIGDREYLACDMGGQIGFAMSMWKPHLANSHGVLFVFDSANPTKVQEARHWLNQTLKWIRSDAVLLFLANKKDLKEAMSLEDIVSRLDLTKIMTKRPHTFAVYHISALYNDGVNEAMNWLNERTSRIRLAGDES
ncbi:MAG: ADP-ribosylation factor-like protein [Candidatus Thorarchaeota archaeon]